MRKRALLSAILIITALTAVTFVHTQNGFPVAHGAVNPKLKILNSTYGGNITDITSALSPGQSFTVDVAVQDAGMLTGFDIAVGYSMNQRLTPPILEEDLSLAGGIFNGNGLPSNCNPYTIRTDVLADPVYKVRIAEVILGGCQVDATNGVLFSITFRVTGSNATSIDVQEASAGSKNQLLVGGPSNSVLPNIEVTGAYFRNTPGLPPKAQFTFTPSAPAVGSTVDFNATLSSDDHASGTSKGIRTMIWDFSDANPNIVGSFQDHSLVHHVFLVTPTVLGSGYYTVTLIVVDSDDGLPGIQRTVVFITEGKIHDVALSIAEDKPVANVGDTVQVTVTVVNRGNQNENIKLDVSYDYQGSTSLSPDSGPSPGNFSLTLSSARATFKYTVPTANLSPRTYTVKSVAALLGNATDSKPDDNMDTVSFTLHAKETTPALQQFSVTTLAIGAAVAVAAALGGVQLMRRRKRAKETSEESLA